MQPRKAHTVMRRAWIFTPGFWWVVATGLMLAIGAAACSNPTLSSYPVPSAAPASMPGLEIQCIPWYDAPDHIGEDVCVEGRIVEVHAADTPRPAFAFFIFDPTFNDFDYVYGKFYAWVHSDDWSEYFSDGQERGAFSAELDGACAHVFGTVEKKWGSRIQTAVTERSQIEIVDCAACQIPEACVLPRAESSTTGDQGTVLLIIAPSGFNDDEYSKVRAILETAGYAVVVASRSLDLADGDYGLVQAQPSVVLADTNMTDYDAAVFIGGRGSTVYWDDAEAHRIAREAAGNEKVLAATSIAPVILARAGVLDGKQATVYDPATHCPELEAGGARCTGERVQRDGRIVTARLEQAADQFAETIVQVLQEL
jgi:protease I